MVTLDDVLPYVDLGWSLIPMRFGNKKKPACRRWKPFQSARADHATLKLWFERGQAGVAVVFGSVSGGLISRDFDEMPAYEQWAAEHPDLARTLPTVETRRGRHVYACADPAEVAQLRRAIGKPDGTGAINCGDGEFRAGVGCYSVLPPSRRPCGFTYRWLRSPFDAPLPLIRIQEAGFLDAHVRATESNGEHRDNGGTQRTTEAIGSACVCVNAKDMTGNFPEGVRRTILESLPTGPGNRNKQVFELARALKAVPSLADADPRELKPLVRHWHKLALPHITSKAFEETLIDFLRAWPRVKFPKGGEPMSQIFSAAVQAEVPEIAAEYEQDGLRLLVALCRELQRAAADGPFYLSCRTAGRLLNVDHTTAWRWLFLLEQNEVLRVVSRGSQASRRASRYRYLGDL